MDAKLQKLYERVGIAFDSSFDAKLLPKGVTYTDFIGMDHTGGLVAMDAAYPLVTTANSGIPAMFSTWVDPKIIDVMVAPMEAVAAGGSEAKKGDWLTDTAMFELIESTGEVTSYGDYSNSGSAGYNVNFPQRQSYHYQVFTQWGEKELAKMSLAKVDDAARKNIASALALNKYQNKSYLFGVAGLQNYGLLNDPSLPADLVPVTKAAGGTAWIDANGAVKATALEVLADFSKMFYALQQRNKGKVTRSTKMRAVMSPESEVALTITNEFNVNVADLLKKNYPGIEIVVVPEYATAAGQKVQLIVDEVDGQVTVECAFTEKMRAHAIVIESSSFKQKKSAGTWGTIWYRPSLCSSLIGI